MKKTTIFFFTSLCLLFTSIHLYSQSNVKYGSDYIVFEAEDTDTPLGSNWTVRQPGDPLYLKYLLNTGSSPAPINNTYLDYTGPWLGEGTELEYKFTCPKTGKYQIAMRMHSPLRESNNPNKGIIKTVNGEEVWWEKADLRNDFFIKMSGNFTSGSSKHTETDLRSFHKFFGRGANKWGTCINLEHNGNNGAFYNLTEGEEYTFYLKGRSATTGVDYITLYDTSYLAHSIDNQGPDLALQLPTEIRPYETPTAISLSSNPTEIRTGTSIQFKTSVTPTNGNPKTTWTTSNDQILSVDENGLITAQGAIGQKATITATSTINNALTTSLEVTIIDFSAIPVTAVSVSPTEKVIVQGTSNQLTATVLPIDADNKTVTWSSSNETIATVDQNGNVTGVTEGVVIIRATSNDTNTIFAEAEIEIGAFFAQSISFDDDSKYKNETFYNTGNMEVTLNYHAGSLKTIKSLKLYLRELNSSWEVQNDVLIDLTETIGETSGTITTNIPLDNLTPTEDLPSGNFYFLFALNENSESVKVNKALNPILILNKNLLSFENVPKEYKTISVYQDSNLDGQLNIDGLISGNYHLKIYSVLGKEIYQSSFSANSNNNSTSINNLNQGVYILFMETKGILLKTKFIITH